MTNFEKITQSPESLAAWIEGIISEREISLTVSKSKLVDGDFEKLFKNRNKAGIKFWKNFLNQPYESEVSENV